MKDLFNLIEKLPIEMQEICNRFNLEISENGSRGIYAHRSTQRKTFRH